MSFADDVRSTVLRLIDLLEGNALPYLVMGGVAVPIWGVPRATYDIDITLCADSDGLRRFLDVVKAAGFAIDAAFEAGFRAVEWWTESSRRVTVDVFLVTTAYQTAAFARRRRVAIDSRSIWVISAADLILHKLIAARPKDLADVQNILMVQGVPDHEYLGHWARRLGVSQRLAESLHTAGLSG